MARPVKFTEEEFASQYEVMKAEGKKNEQMWSKLEITEKTFKKYLANLKKKGIITRINSPPILTEEKKDIIRANRERADKLISAGYGIHEQMIAEALKSNPPQMEEARRLTIEAMRVIKTDYEREKCLSMYIDASTKNITIQMIPGELMERIEMGILTNFMRVIEGFLNPDQKEAFEKFIREEAQKERSGGPALLGEFREVKG